MNSSLLRQIIALGGFGAILAFPLAASATPDAAIRGASTSSKPAEIAAASGDDASPALTRAEALEKVSAARRYVAHPQKKPGEKEAEPKMTMPDFDMVSAPPTPRTETKPAAPGAGLVWVPGHYMPDKGEWRWVRGEWAVPATPSSVWIPAKYDEKERKWTPGYWQPDAPTATAGEPVGTAAPATSDSTTTPAATPAPSLY